MNALKSDKWLDAIRAGGSGGAKFRAMVWKPSDPTPTTVVDLIGPTMALDGVFRVMVRRSDGQYDEAIYADGGLFTSETYWFRLLEVL